MSCSICSESFKTPVSLPCGHVFCRDCIARTVDSVDECSMQHFCPACRAPYNVVGADPALVPPHLRPHLLPQIRPVYFDPPTQTTSTSERTHFDPDLGHALAENTALRLECATWRRRAEVHAAANQGLLALARTGKTHALRMQAERDNALRRCALLKRKLCELIPDLESKLREPESVRVLPAQSQPSALAPHPHAHARPAVPKRSCSPVSILGPPLKRRRRSASVEAEIPFPSANPPFAPRAIPPAISIAKLVHAAAADAPKSAPRVRRSGHATLGERANSGRVPPHPELGAPSPFSALDATPPPASASPSTPPSPLVSLRPATALTPALWTPPQPTTTCAPLDTVHHERVAELVGWC